MTRKDYVKRFHKFPDLVTVNEFRVMLGGMGETTARKLLRQNIVEHLYVNGTYYIPKDKVIDYMLSPHYMKYRFNLKYVPR